MALFSSAVGWLESVGFFNYLALLLVFIVFYYVFDYLFKRSENFVSRRPMLLLAISIILSLIVTMLCFFFMLGFAGTLASYVTAAIFALIVLFFIGVATGRFMGLKTSFSKD